MPYSQGLRQFSVTFMKFQTKIYQLYITTTTIPIHAVMQTATAKYHKIGPHKYAATLCNLPFLGKKFLLIIKRKSIRL